MSRDLNISGDNLSNPDRFPGIGEVPLAELFPSSDYRHQMRFRRGTIAGFFQPWQSPSALIEQRRLWLERDPVTYTAALPESKTLLNELLEHVRTWPGFASAGNDSGSTEPNKVILSLGQTLEPDLLLLKPDEGGVLRLLAGSVCFPSSWSLAEKMGQSLDWIHHVVPGLNQQLGGPIDTFLRRMTPGVTWLRANWGLSRSPELNQHPSRLLPRLDETVQVEAVWLRVEHQALVALPGSGGVLFGIRVVVHSMEEVIRDSAATVGLRRALETMPEQMAIYKGIASARESLIRLLSQSEVLPRQADD